MWGGQRVHTHVRKLGGCAPDVSHSLPQPHAPQKRSLASTLPAASAFMSLCTPPSPPEVLLKLPAVELRELLVGTPLRLKFSTPDCPAMCVDEPDQVCVGRV